MDLVQRAVGRERWRQGPLVWSPTAPWLGLVEKTRRDCMNLGKCKGHVTRVLGGCKGLSVALAAHFWSLSTSWNGAQRKTSHHQSELSAHDSAPHGCIPPVVISQGSCGHPKKPLPVPCREARKKHVHNEKSTCFLTQFWGAAQRRLQKPPLGSHSYSQTLGNEQKKGVFHSKPRSFSGQKKAFRLLVLKGTWIIGKSMSGVLCPWH